MFPVFIDIEKHGVVAPSIRVQRQLFKAGYRAVAEYWRDRMLARHFTHRARHIYGYRQRTAKYLKKKRKLAARGIVKKGGRVDLVFTGRLERQMQARHRVQVFPTRAVVRMVGPNYLKINYRAGRPHLARELTKVTPEEIRKLDAVAADAIAAEIDSIQTTTRRKVR